jgi:hypothetical protein
VGYARRGRRREGYEEEEGYGGRREEYGRRRGEEEYEGYGGGVEEQYGRRRGGEEGYEEQQYSEEVGGGYGGGGYGGGSYGQASALRAKSKEIPIDMLTQILSERTGHQVDVGNIRTTLFDMFGDQASPTVKMFANLVFQQLQVKIGDALTHVALSGVVDCCILQCLSHDVVNQILSL